MRGQKVWLCRAEGRPGRGKADAGRLWNYTEAGKVAGKGRSKGKGGGTHSVPFPRDRAATVAYCGALCCNSRLVRGHGRTESLSTDNSNRQEWVLTTSCAHACINAKPQKTGPHPQRGRTAAPSICRASSVILEPQIPFSCFQPHLWPA